MSSVLTVMLVCKHMEASDVDAPSPLSVKRLDIMQTSWRFHTGLVKKSPGKWMLFGLQPHHASVSCQNKQICNKLTV